MPCSAPQGLTWQKAISGLELRCPIQNRPRATKKLFPFRGIFLIILAVGPSYEQCSYCESSFYNDSVFAESESFGSEEIPWSVTSQLYSRSPQIFRYLFLLHGWRRPSLSKPSWFRYPRANRLARWSPLSLLRCGGSKVDPSSAVAKALARLAWSSVT